MGFWQIVLLILKYGPGVVGLIREIYDLIQHARVSENDRPKLLATLWETADHCKRTKDQQPLREMRDGMHALLGRQ